MSTQLHWEGHYKQTHVRATTGLYCFNKGDLIQRREDGIYFLVVERSALTATIRKAFSYLGEFYPRGPSLTIQQFDKNYAHYCRT